MLKGDLRGNASCNNERSRSRTFCTQPGFEVELFFFSAPTLMTVCVQRPFSGSKQKRRPRARTTELKGTHDCCCTSVVVVVVVVGSGGVRPDGGWSGPRGCPRRPRFPRSLRIPRRPWCPRSSRFPRFGGSCWGVVVFRRLGDSFWGARRKPFVKGFVFFCLASFWRPPPSETADPLPKRRALFS